MTPDAFIAEWSGATLSERAAQFHFLDLCALLGEPTPAEADPHGDFYCFERGATKTTGGKGWADVWKRGFFGWEYKGKRRDLDAAYAYAEGLRSYCMGFADFPNAAGAATRCGQGYGWSASGGA